MQILSRISVLFMEYLLLTFHDKVQNDGGYSAMSIFMGAYLEFLFFTSYLGTPPWNSIFITWLKLA